MQGCPLSGRGFTAALVAIDKDVCWDPVICVSRPLGGQIWCKRSRRFQHQYLIKIEQMDFEGRHSCSCCHQKVAASCLGGLQVLPGVLYGFSAGSHCRWPSGEMVMQRLTLSSHIKKVLAPVLKLGLHVLRVFGLSYRDIAGVVMLQCVCADYGVMAWRMLCFVSSESCQQVSVTEESPEPETGAPGTRRSAPSTHQSVWDYGFIFIMHNNFKEDSERWPLHHH